MKLAFLTMALFIAVMSAAEPPAFLPPSAWNQWRGAARDGNVNAVAPLAWPKELKEQWKTIVGVGHSSPVAGDGKIFIFARRDDEEVIAALDETGKELWKSSNPVAYEMHSAARGHGKGPKSTPIVYEGKIFTLGITGVLSSHDTKTGKLIWRNEFAKQFPSTSPAFGTAMSPLISNGLLIAHVGGDNNGALMAFNPETGKVIWSYKAGPAYASPVLATIDGLRQLVTFTQRELVGLDAATGELLWTIAAKTAYDENCNTPIIYRETVIVSLEEGGIVALRPTKQGKEWTTKEVWRNRENELHMNSPVLQGNLLFGLSAKNKGQLFALDADTGKSVWQGPGRAGENAAILNMGGTLLVLTNEARLLVQPATGKSFGPIAEYTVANSPTWAHPLILGDRILVKDETTLRSLSLK